MSLQTRQLFTGSLGLSILLGTIIVFCAEIPQKNMEADQVFTYSKDYYTYTFRKGDKLTVIVGRLNIFKDPALRKPLWENEEDAMKFQRWLIVSEEVTAEDLKGEAVAIRWTKRNQEITGWVTGWGLKPLDYKGEIAHEQSAGGVICCFFGGTFLSLVIGIGGLLVVRRIFGPVGILVLCGLIALACLLGAVTAILTGSWGSAITCFILMLIFSGIGKFLARPKS